MMAEGEEPLSGMMYANDAGIVTRSPESLENMMPATVGVSGLMGLKGSKPTTRIMCLFPKGVEECLLRVNIGDQIYKQIIKFVYLGGTICEGGKMKKEMENSLDRAWG